jgi:hypothetical protein
VWKPWIANKERGIASAPISSEDGTQDIGDIEGNSRIDIHGEPGDENVTTNGRDSGRSLPRRRRRGDGTRARTSGFRGRAALAVAAGAAALARIVGAASIAEEPTGGHRPPVVARIVSLSGEPPIRYPRPHRDGFRDVNSPGFEEEEREHIGREGAADDFALVAETVNATGWGPLQRRLRDTHAHLVLAQETWTLQGQQCAATDWTRNNG